MSMEQARRRAMWFNGCNRYKGNDNTQNKQNETVSYFEKKYEPKKQRTAEEIMEERLYYTSTR